MYNCVSGTDHYVKASSKYQQLCANMWEARWPLMVNEVNSGSSGQGSSPGWGHCVVFMGKTLYSHSASLHPGV